MLLRASPDSSTMPLTDSTSLLGGYEVIARIALAQLTGAAETDVVCAIAIRNDGGILPLLAFGLRGIESDGETTA